MQELDASEFLYTMAQAYRNIFRNGDPQTVRLKDISPYSSQALNDASADSLTKLQFWTYRPVRWRTSPIGIENEQHPIPVDLVLYQNYPNPFNPITRIRFDIPLNQHRTTNNLQLVIYDILGREIGTLANEQLKPGSYEVEFGGTNYSSGVYFCKLVAGNVSQTKKMVLIK